MKWLVRHQVRATPLGLPSPMCEPKSPVDYLPRGFEALLAAAEVL